VGNRLPAYKALQRELMGIMPADAARRIGSIVNKRLIWISADKFIFNAELLNKSKRDNSATRKFRNACDKVALGFRKGFDR